MPSDQLAETCTTLTCAKYTAYQETLRDPYPQRADRPRRTHRFPSCPPGEQGHFLFSTCELWSPSCHEPASTFADCRTGTGTREGQHLLPTKGGRGKLPTTDSSHVARSGILTPAAAESTTQDPSGQEESVTFPKQWHLETLGEVYHTSRGVPTVCQRSKQASTVCRDQRHGLLQDSEEMGQDIEIEDKGAVPVESSRSSAILQRHCH